MGRKVNCSKAWDLGLQSIIQSKFVKIYEQLENHPVTLKLVFIGISPPPLFYTFPKWYSKHKNAKYLSKAMVFPVVMYGCESWTIKKAECWRIDAFELWCWKRLLRVPWTARRSNQSILKEISPGCSLEGLMLKLKLQYFGHLMWRADPFEKDRDAGKDWGQEGKGTTEDEMVGWHHQLDGHGFG